jgi:hypothetical protein
MEILLKAHRPDKYVERRKDQIQHTVALVQASPTDEKI